MFGVFGLLLLAGSTFAEDSLRCSGKKLLIELTIPERGKVALQINGTLAVDFKESWIVSMNAKSEAIVPEELSLLMEPKTQPKKEYRFENLRHCGEGEDIRVRIYETAPRSKIFVEELACNCKRV